MSAHRRLLDWLVGTGLLDYWRGTDGWIGRLILHADLRWLKRTVAARKAGVK